jgi:hypothetical protein
MFGRSLHSPSGSRNQMKSPHTSQLLFVGHNPILDWSVGFARMLPYAIKTANANLAMLHELMTIEPKSPMH